MRTGISRLGYYSAFIAFISIVSFGIVQALQVIGVTHYPLDAILIYATSLSIAPPLLISIIALHHSISVLKRVWTHVAISFSVVYLTFVMLMYVVQLAVVIPFHYKKEGNEILTDSPHSLFWTIDALGYICMGIATLFCANAFKGNPETKWQRRFFLANGLMTPLIAFVYFYPHFSYSLLILAFPWIVTASGSMLSLALYFKRREQKPGRI